MKHMSITIVSNINTCTKTKALRYIVSLKKKKKKKHSQTRQSVKVYLDLFDQEAPN